MGESVNWFTRHSDALVNEVTHAWKSFEKNISHDYAREKRSDNAEKQALSAEISSLIVRGARIEALQEENDTLRARLATTLQAARSSPRPSTASRDLPRSSPESADTVATEPAVVPYKDYAELTKKYNDLKNDFDAYRVGYETVLKKYQGSKKAVKEWQAYIDRCRAKGTVLKGSPAPLKLEQFRADDDVPPDVARHTSEAKEYPRELRPSNFSPVSIAPSYVSSTLGGIAATAEFGRTTSPVPTRYTPAAYHGHEPASPQRPVASGARQSQRSALSLSNLGSNSPPRASGKAQSYDLDVEQADASAVGDVLGSISRLPPDMVTEMSQHREPVRSSHWLRACFEKDLITEVPQSVIWKAYTDTFQSYSDQVPLMKMSTFMNHILNVFPGASNLQVSQEDGTAFIVRGIKPRVLVEPQNSNADVSAQQETRNVSALPSSSQTTADATSGQEGDNQNHRGNAYYDEDSPIVVSSRSLKRKQPLTKSKSAVMVHKDADEQIGTPTKPIRVKEEDFSSPVLAPGQINPLTRTSTLDLDEFEKRNDTPRKRRRLEEMLRRSQFGSIRHRAINSLLQERSTSMPPDVDDPLSDQPDQATGANALCLARSNSDPVKIEGEGSNELPDLDPHRVTSGEPRTAKNHRARALRALSPNTRILPRTSGLLGRTRRKEEGRGAKAIHAVAEDGEMTRKQKSSASVAESNDRLRYLLQAPTPVKQALSDAITPVPTRLTRTPDLTTAFKNTRSRAHAQTFDASNEQDPDAVDPDQEPLRARPLHRLNIDDFKINPAYNQGLDYAFVEAVRNRDARRCLPGCTRPECCGSAFRALVEAGANPTIARGIWDGSQDSADDEERLLADYLGTSYSRAKMVAMSEEERMELLVQARTKLMADRHGRHRQAYERRATPPGFWRSDMPTTQEIERDREEARQLAKRKVEERYMEAMREGGRWIFRDE